MVRRILSPCHILAAGSVILITVYLTGIYNYLHLLPIIMFGGGDGLIGLDKESIAKSAAANAKAKVELLESDLFPKYETPFAQRLPDARLIVLTYDRVEQLRILLQSLKAAHFGDDRVDMDIWIDAKRIDGGNEFFIDEDVLKVSDNFEWKQGKKTVHHRTSNVGLQTQWIDTWDTERLIKQNQSEIALILEDDLTLSPWFYLWLKGAHFVYGKRPEIAGISLQRVTLCAKIGCSGLNGGNIPVRKKQSGVLLYPIVGSWGFSPTLHSWNKFQKWFHDSGAIDGKVDPIVDGLTPSLWYQNEVNNGKCPGAKCIWTMFHIFYTYHNLDKWTVYYKAPRKTTLASNARAKGLHFSDPKLKFRSNNNHPDFPIMEKMPIDLLSFPVVPFTTGYDSKLTSHTFQLAIQLNLIYGFINLQLLNSGYLEMTKSFICNMGNLIASDPTILERTLIVATDRNAYLELDNFRKLHPTLKFNLAFENFDDQSSQQDLTYGERKYFDYMLWRTGFISNLLLNGVNVFLTEADAVWLKSPFVDSSIMHEKNDIVAADNRPPDLIPNGGFLFLRSRPGVVAAWKEVLNWQVEHRNSLGILSTRNEQFVERDIFMAYYAAHKLNLFWVPPNVIASGKWYTDEGAHLHSAKNIVILNNWIAGNESKIRRAKEYRQWFLAEDQSRCLTG